ncbi:hypothetical protein HHO41_12520 [Bacillus sp. DNRA2]|uniref:hypothetical protein n=1 Tax=Bacillus sp. DNRA2 TaxID=2723053 RepID=UPI00145CADE6|nr:hypothetical protein [Bacillus sp. DNRA2]NMD71123.1 hypothetical protein [Bacillus sp. DNRA2]
MNQQESYNLAVDYMKDELFDEALIILENMVNENVTFDQARWVTGLAYVFTGYPAKALQIWSEITDKYCNGVMQAMETVEAKLPLYQKIYQTYNDALMHVFNSDYQRAAILFEETIGLRWEVPLPVECYQGYILTKIIVGDEKLAFDEMINLPAYIRKRLVIQELGEELHHYLAEYRNSKAIFTDKIRRRSNMLDLFKRWLQNTLR